MLNHPTLDKLKTLKLYGMIQGLPNQAQHPAIDQMSFEGRFGLLVDREMTDRLDRRLKNRLHQAKLKQNACLEDVNYQADRGLDKALLQGLQDCQWIKKHLNVLITGPTVSVNPGLPAPWRKKPVEKVIQPSISVCRGYSRSYRWLKGMAATANSLIAWAKRMSCCWMIGAWQH
jgi:IstB-like ATP binding protein